MNIKLKYILFIFVFLVVGQNCQAQFEIPPKPKIQSPLAVMVPVANGTWKWGGRIGG